MKKLIAAILAVPTLAFAGQNEDQRQGQNSTTINSSTYAPTHTGDNESLYSGSSGNYTSTDIGRTSVNSSQQVQSQSQSQSQSGSLSGSHSGSGSVSGAATTTGGAANTSSGGAQTSSGDSSTNSGANTQNSNNQSNSTSRNRAYALSVNRVPVATLPMNCIVSEAASVDVLVFGASKSSSKMDEYCIRKQAVASACHAAQSLDAVDSLKAEYARETAAALECADERISKAFPDTKSCAAAMKIATCPMAPKQVIYNPLPAPMPQLAPTPALAPIVQVIERTTHEVRYLPAPVQVKPKAKVKTKVKPLPIDCKKVCNAQK